MRFATLHHKHFLQLLLLLLALFAPSTVHFGGVQALSSSHTITRLSLRSSTPSLKNPTFASLPSRLSQSNDDNLTPQERPEMNPALQLLGKSTSTVVAGTFFVVLAWKRDALMVSFFVGAIANGILSKVLKKIIRQERPMEDYGGDSSETISILEPPPPSDNGMPSSHAMSLGFIGTFTGLLLAQKYHPYSSLLLVVYASISLWYRIESKLHTWEQVAVGVTVGSTNALLWRCVCFGTTQPFRFSTTTQDFPIHFMEFVTKHWLNEEGLLPITGLIIPVIVGALVVGSVERRIGRFLKMRKDGQEAESKET